MLLFDFVAEHYRYSAISLNRLVFPLFNSGMDFVAVIKSNPASKKPDERNFSFKEAKYSIAYLIIYNIRGFNNKSTIVPVFSFFKVITHVDNRQRPDNMLPEN
jgi:hypothetical protein